MVHADRCVGRLQARWVSRETWVMGDVVQTWIVAEVGEKV